MKTDREARIALGVELLLSAVVFAAVLVADGIGSAIFAGALLVSLTVVLHVGRTRSETVEVMTGIGDERTRSIAQTAAAWTAYVMITVLIGWWLIALVTGADDAVQNTLGALGALSGVAWVVCTVIARRRS